MKRSTLTPGILYLVLGLIFANLALQNLQHKGEWGLFSIILVIIATFDIGGGLRMIAFHIKLKKVEKNIKK